jgi:pyruvate formate lyase activating enzyme
MKGRIHSIESMGLVDGPGIRTVVFFQGCALRCSYCHNPDTWSCDGGTEIDSGELIKKILRYKPYFEKSGGGVTFSGGDPLMQPDFLIEMLKLCKDHKIHTAIDTAGYGAGKVEEILKYTDLVILDIKHTDDKKYKDLTGRDMSGFITFLALVNKTDVKLWIRHVVVPGITDSEEHIAQLAQIIKKINNVEKVELLPYHKLGNDKYKQLGISYRLIDLEPLPNETLNNLNEVLKKHLFN